MNVYWKKAEVEGHGEFWSLIEDDRLVLTEEPDGTLVKNETGRHPLTFGNVEEPITGKFGRRKAY